MNMLTVWGIGLKLITALPSLEASVSSAVALISHIHSLADAEAAGKLVVENFPALISAVLQNTPTPPNADQPA